MGVMGGMGLGELRQRDTVGGAALVFRADDDDQLVSGNLRNGEYRVINRALDKPKFGQTLMDSFSHLRRVADAKADVDTRIGAPKGDEMPGQPIVRDRMAGMERQCAPPQTSQFGEHQFRRFRARQHGTGLAKKERTRLRQLNSPPDPVKQLRAMSRLQGRHGGTDGGLREVQGVRRPGAGAAGPRVPLPLQQVVLR